MPTIQKISRVRARECTYLTVFLISWTFSHSGMSNSDRRSILWLFIFCSLPNNSSLRLFSQEGFCPVSADIKRNHFTAFCGNIQYNKTQYAIISLLGGGIIFRRVRDLREDHDLKQRELATYLSCSQQVYSNYELGQRDIPTDVLIKLSQLYDVSTDYILGLTNNPKRNH